MNIETKVEYADYRSELQTIGRSKGVDYRFKVRAIGSSKGAHYRSEVQTICLK